MMCVDPSRPFGPLQAGDEILSINGLYLAESTHEEVVNVLRSRKNMLLKLRSECTLFGA